jgi:hypothetical protein
MPGPDVGLARRKSSSWANPGPDRQARSQSASRSAISAGLVAVPRGMDGFLAASGCPSAADLTVTSLPKALPYSWTSRYHLSLFPLPQETTQPCKSTGISAYAGSRWTASSRSGDEPDDRPKPLLVRWLPETGSRNACRIIGSENQPQIVKVNRRRDAALSSEGSTLLGIVPHRTT